MTNNLSKHDLIKAIAMETGETQTAVAFVLDALQVTTRDALKQGQAVTIPGLVKLTPTIAPARMIRGFDGVEKALPERAKIKATVLSGLKA